MTQSAAQTLAALRERFLALFTRKEDLFWEVKMGLGADVTASRQALADADAAYNDFLQDPARLSELRALGVLSDAALETERQGWERFFACYTIEDTKAQALAAELLKKESELAGKRAGFAVGYVDPDSGEFVRATTNKLALMISNEADERLRKAALEGMYAIERFVLAEGFLDIVKLRNQLGRALGYEDFYDWRVHTTEGQSKRAIFARLDHFLAATKASQTQALADFAAKHGESALLAHNFSFIRGGSTASELSPYYPFADSLERWAKSFSALGIRYHGATLTLDLVDRVGKYENGFMHGPGPTFEADGVFHKARINFTANAVPGAVGSGNRATQTLFHEGGHAAHFANIQANSPCFSVEYAPTSVAYAETQSMFCDSLIQDADWRARYAKNAAGEVMPFDLIAREIEETQPFAAFDIARLIVIPLGERLIYELSEDELTPENVIARLRELEQSTLGLSGSPRPILAVPHLLANESSAYYHAYILAEMAVRQVRHFFLARDGYLTDNPKIGPDIAKAMWAPGNRVSHDETLIALTGQPLSADALISDCQKTVAECIVSAKEDYARGLSAPAPDSLELDAHVRVIHGKESIADSAGAGLKAACQDFATWIHNLEAVA